MLNIDDNFLLEMCYAITMFSKVLLRHNAIVCVKIVYIPGKRTRD